MGYDANSPQARKGALGEQIVKKDFESIGWHVQRPGGVSEDTPTHIDWICTLNGKIVCVEVKTYKKFFYSFNKVPTFKIPLAWYENYKNESRRLGASVFLLAFVSSEDGKIYLEESQYLDKKIRRDGYDFPVIVHMKDGDPEICFHVDQFAGQLPLVSDDLAALRAIDEELSSDQIQDKNDFDRKVLWDEVSIGLGIEYEQVTDKAIDAFKELCDEYRVDVMVKQKCNKRV